MTQHPMQKWIATAGIKKHLTFHCLRHSYGTILKALGVDIYTIKELLQHRNVSTTQIYVDTMAEDKREAASLIKLNIF